MIVRPEHSVCFSIGFTLGPPTFQKESVGAVGGCSGSLEDTFGEGSGSPDSPGVYSGRR